jgi:hypothetical protein
MPQPKKNLFFPLSPDDEVSLEEEEQENDTGEDDGYGPLTNDWYDLPGGQYYIYFEKNSKYRKETE